MTTDRQRQRFPDADGHARVRRRRVAGLESTNRLSSRAEKLVMRAVGRAGVGLNALFGRRAGVAVGIVTYHRVAERVHGLPRPTNNVTPKRFRQQLAGLLTRGFQIWPLRKVLAYRENGVNIPQRILVITFDDGFQTLYTRAWPILQELQVPATVFVSTAYLDTSDPFWFDTWGTTYGGSAPAETYRPLTTGQLQEMLQDGLLDVGAHAHTHQDFRRRPNDFRADLQKSVDFVRSRFHCAEVPFAFPFGCRRQGYASDELLAVARQTGVLCALSIDSALVDPRSDPCGWGRFHVFGWDTSATLAAKLDGWYSWASKLRHSLSQTRRRVWQPPWACHARGGL